MRKLILGFLLILVLLLPVGAAEFTAPVPEGDAGALMPVEVTSFGSDLLQILRDAVSTLQPHLADAMELCMGIFAVCMLMSLVPEGRCTSLVGVLGVSALLLGTTRSMVTLAADTVLQLSQYGKLLLPIMTSAMAAQGGITASGALYVGTAAFDAILGSGIAKLLIPMVYIYLALAVGHGATGETMLEKLRDLTKNAATWCLKTVLYIFTGYMAITGVVSGTADAAAVRATKLTVSGMIPVVGGILSDASEAVIIGAGVMKSAAGVYGMLAAVAIWITPFLRIGIQYLLLKLTGALCEVFSVKPVSGVVSAFSGAMGLLLGMTGAVCMLILVSTVCFMKGVG